MRMVGNLAKVLAPAALLVASSAFAHDVLVPADPVTIKSIQTNGSGCPLGTVVKNISEDKQAFTLTFSEFIAETGPNLGLVRRNCQTIVTLKVPVGWQYSIGSFTNRGFMGLDEGIKASHTATYYFQGSQNNGGTFRSTKFGPYTEDFVFTDKIGMETVVMPDSWSDCFKDRALNINTELRIDNVKKSQFPDARGLIANDAQDGEISQVFGLTWRRCQ